MDYTNIYNFFPGLSYSTEVYFGMNAPLAQHLILYATQLKGCLKSMDDFKSKSVKKELYKIVNDFNVNIAKDLNCERVQLCINPDPTDNAGAYTLFYGSDVNDIIESKNGKKVKILNLDKVADLEDIVITKEGYKFRNPHGKILILLINFGCIKNLDVNGIAGSLAHELGHCFQQGIFGVYKDIADKELATKIAANMRIVSPLTDGSLLSSLKIFVQYLILPATLIANAANGISRKLFRNRFSSYTGSNTRLMKDELAEIDKGNNELLKQAGGQLITDHIIANGASDTEKRNQMADEVEAEFKAEIEKVGKENPKPEKKHKNHGKLYNFFRGLNARINQATLGALQVITLTNYSVGKWNQEGFIQKYEYFADIFASSYGFGPHLYKNYVEMEMNNVKAFTSQDLVGINDPKLLKMAFIKKKWNSIRRLMMNDVHGTAQTRGKAMYTALVKELETNPNLTTQQKKQIRQSIVELQIADEVIYKDQKENNGFWVKYYEEVIQDRIDGIDARTDEEILKPIQRAYEKSEQKI